MWSAWLTTGMNHRMDSGQIISVAAFEINFCFMHQDVTILYYVKSLATCRNGGLLNTKFDMVT